jgi:hypothetical protein
MRLSPFRKKATSALFGTLFFAFLSFFIGLVAMTSGVFFLDKVQEPPPGDSGSLVCPGYVPVSIEKACYSARENDASGTVTIYLKNYMDRDISLDSFWFRIRQGNDLSFQYGSGVIKQGSVKRFDFAFSNDLGSPEMLSILPVIKKDSRDYLCTENAVEQKIRECSS